jgi:hypothetical protein
MLIITMVVGDINLSSIIVLILQVCVGFGVYVVILIMLKDEWALKYITEVIEGLKGVKHG